MAIKKSVRLVDETIKLCNELTTTTEAREGVNWSGSLNAMAEQYKALVTDCLPELTEDQKTAFYCSYNGYIPPATLDQEINMLAWNIDQAYQYDSQVTDLLGNGKEATAFIEKVKGWSRAQKIAVIYMARSYWRQGQIAD